MMPLSVCLRIPRDARPGGLLSNKISSLGKETMKTVDELMRETFEQPRDPCSLEYKEGVRAMLEARINNKPLRCPYKTGTVQADDFFAGCYEGARVANEAGYPYRSKLI